MCKFLKDDQVVGYNTREGLQDYLDFRKKHDRWLESNINSMRIISGEADPEQFKRKHNCLLPVEGIKECHEQGTNMFLELYISVNGAMKRGVIPIRNTAVRTILDRARINGFSLLNDVEDTGINVLPDNKKAEIISDCLRLYSAQAKVLYRDEEISAVHSGQYAILTEADIIKNFEEKLSEDFSDWSFEDAVVSHSFFSASYRLNCEEIEEDIQMMLSDIGEDATSIKSKVRIFSSDVGTAAVHVLSFLEIDGHAISFGKPKTIKHAGKKTVEDIKKETGKLFSVFKECPEDMRRLSETKIEHPAGCLRSIAKEMHLPKKISCETADELEERTVSACTAYEIYWYLNDIAGKYEAACDDVFRNMNVRETVAECLKLDFRKFDKEFEWARKEKEDVE